MKRLLLGMALLLVTGTTGCAMHTHPVNIDTMAGTDHMPKGPGLLDRNSPYASDDGLVVYSSNPNQPSLLGSGRAKTSPGATPVPAQPAAGAASAAPPQAPPQNYQEFREYQAYQQFMSLPKDSPEYQRFQQWLQWKYYEQWKASHGQ